jgi:hypothetical protein
MKILRIGCLYEFSAFDGSYTALGRLQCIDRVSLTFNILAIKDDEESPISPEVDSSSRCIMNDCFNSLDVVAVENLPLYIGWAWKSREFMNRLRGVAYTIASVESVWNYGIKLP